MNDPRNPHLSSRRSFIKKSIVASVAVSSMTIFSGLVYATDPEEGENTKCTITKAGPCSDVLINEGTDEEEMIYTCMAKCDPRGKKPVIFQVQCDRNTDEIDLNSNDVAKDCEKAMVV